MVTDPPVEVMPPPLVDAAPEVVVPPPVVDALDDAAPVVPPAVVDPPDDVEPEVVVPFAADDEPVLVDEPPPPLVVDAAVPEVMSPAFAPVDPLLQPAAVAPKAKRRRGAVEKGRISIVLR
jgi:hypothetical protein